MTPKGGRPRTFPVAAVPIALERHAAGETWAEIANDLKVRPGTLQARASEYRRSRTYKTPASPPDRHAPPIRSSEPTEVEIVVETFRSPRLCPTCGMVHSPEVPCP